MAQSDPLFYGVDFSGAAQPRDAIWITEAVPRGDTLAVTNSMPAWKRFELSRSASREGIYEKILAFIGDHPNGVFGFDFPFSLPRKILEVDSWRQHIETMPNRFDTETPDEFREACTMIAQRETDSAMSHLRRETDFRYAAQCPYQRQIQNQTLYGQSDLLQPVIEADQARIVPMQTTTPGLPILVEVYPAATLGVLRLYRSGYKNHDESQSRREHMVKELEGEGFDLPPEVSECCIKNDDALDSVICAIAAYRAYSNDFRTVEEAAEIEGQIFA